MKKYHKWLWKGTAAVALLAFSGCYNYKTPAAAVLGESYSQRQKDAADDLLKDISTLSLRDAQRIAIKNNPSYIAAYHAMEAARLKYLQSLGAYSPTVSASVSLDYSPTWDIVSGKNPRRDVFTVAPQVRADMLIFDGFARYFKVKAAKSGYNYQAYMEEDACRTMMEAVSYAYNSVLLAIENRRIALADREFQLESLKNTKYKFEAGTVPKSDVLNFEILAEAAEVSLINADYQYEIAVFALAQLMGYPEGTIPSHVKFPERNPQINFADLPAVELYLDAALANRPDLKAYREQLNIAQYQVYQSWGAFSPVVKGYFGWGYRGQDVDNYKSESTSLNMGITADWVIFNGAIRYNQLRESQAQQAVAEYQLANQWFTVVSQVRTAYANYVQNVKKTKKLAHVQELTKEQRDLVKAEYDAGKVELTRYNEAQRDYVESETSLASSYINVQNAKAQLTAVSGGADVSSYLSDTRAEEIYPGLYEVPAAPVSEVPAAGSKEDKIQEIPVSATAPAGK